MGKEEKRILNMPADGSITADEAYELLAALGFLCVWSIFLLALQGTIFTLQGQHSAWLYLRVAEKDGDRFAIGMPVPLNLVGWSLRLARPFVPRNQLVHL